MDLEAAMPDLLDGPINVLNMHVHLSLDVLFDADCNALTFQEKIFDTINAI
jgi:hypothetical protein